MKNILYSINPFYIMIITQTIIYLISMNLHTNYITSSTHTKLFVLTKAIQANSCFHLMLPDDEAKYTYPEKFKKPKD